MRTNDGWRQALGRPGLTDGEIDEFLADLDTLLTAFLDDFFREELEPDDPPRHAGSRTGRAGARNNSH